MSAGEDEDEDEAEEEEDGAADAATWRWERWREERGRAIEAAAAATPRAEDAARRWALLQQECAAPAVEAPTRACCMGRRRRETELRKARAFLYLRFLCRGRRRR